ncbi:MAG: phosphatase, partial [Raoultibacter sp.]
TNHDTTVGLDQAIASGKARGITVIGGIEISAYDPRRKRKVHVLGYGLADNSPAIAALCTPILARREANSRWQLERLLEAGYDVDLELVERLAGASTALYKQHLMAGLTEDPYGSDTYKSLYRGLFKESGICVSDIEYVDACDAVRAIREDGGVPVLAHPGQLGSYPMVDELVECGLMGIEKYHPDHRVKDWALCATLAESRGLICTGGSDYHGAFGSVPHLGYRITDR